MAGVLRSTADVINAYKGGQQSNVKKQDLIYATLTRVDGKVRVVGQPQYVNYIPENGGEPNIVFNTIAPELPDMPVVIGVREGQTEREVLWIDKSRLQDGEQLDTPLPQHAGGHGWGHTDPLWIDPRLVTELRVYPVLGELEVNVAPGRYQHNHREFYFGGQTAVDLSSYQPTGSTKRAVGIELIDNAASVTAGPIIARPVLPLPDPAWTGFALAIVVIYGQQNYVDWEDVKNKKIIWNADRRSVGSRLHLYENLS